MAANSRLLCRLLSSSSARSPFAYGEPNFAAVRQSGSFFADNTRFIREVHRLGDRLVLHRPPRFGKSLFLSTLEAYYDAANTAE